MDKNICNRLKMVRDNARLSQSDFAAAIGIGQSSYNEIETGKREPSDPIVIAISSRFRVSEAWLRGGVGEMTDVKPSQTIEETIAGMDLPVDQKLVMLEIIKMGPGKAGEYFIDWKNRMREAEKGRG
jgi:DNA-binding XRE family transcriptional regulator